MSNPEQPDLWSEEGVFARHFPSYEPRIPQQVMYEKVAQAINEDRHLVVEAGTGTGKGLAYLIPIILHARENPSASYVISTATIGLQQQLAYKDVPNAVSALTAAGLIGPGDFTWTVLKGKTNYYCRDRGETFMQNEAGGTWPGANRLAEKLTRWTTDTGDRSELGLNQDELAPWHRVSAQYNGACPFYVTDDPALPPCFLKRARQKAKEVNLTIVNHALLFADLANSEGQLGHASYVVIDEAQRVEEVASEQFGWTLWQGNHRQELNQLSAHPTLAEYASLLIQSWNDYWLSLAECVAEPEYSQDVNTRRITERYRQTIEWQNAVACAAPLKEYAKQLLNAISNEARRAANIGDVTTEASLGPAQQEVQEQLNLITALMGDHDPARVYWLEHTQADGITIHCIPLMVGPILRERLFSRKRSIILTSATLTTDGDDFRMIREQTGFPDDGDELAVGSPFDYARQAQFMSPADLPNPKSYRDFSAATAECLAEVTQQLHGHTLALFTSYAALNDCAKRLRQMLPDNLVVMAQGQNGTPESIIENFKSNQQAIILGAATFWEGVDFGDLLRAVAICRLPFPVPTDPVIQARSQLYQDPFSDYHVPMALLRFRQGCGRLIRNRNSVGSIIVLDPRIRNKRYGQRFYRSLPPCSPVKSHSDTVGNLAAGWVQAAPDRIQQNANAA